MQKIVRKVIHQCKTCTANKSLNYSTQVFQRPLMPALSVGQVLHMDILTHLPTVKDQHQIFTQILVVVDRLSRRIHLEPIVADATSTTIINTLVKLFTRHHFPKAIVADLDAKFTSRVFEKFLETSSVNVIFATPNHHQSNGLAERNIGTVFQLPSIIISRPSNTSSITQDGPSFDLSINMFSPWLIFFGIHHNYLIAT